MSIKTMNGKFAIKSVKFPNYALNVYGTSVGSGKNVCLYPYSSNDPMQQWIPQAQGNNVYKISTAQSGACKIVLDHYRVTPVDNCDVYTTGASNSNGTISDDLMDQQIQFDKGTDGYYTIYLYNNGKKDKVLTCASTVNENGASIPSSITATNNVYWAALSSSLGTRQKWNIVYLEGTNPASATILPNAQAYIQRDNTWAYLTTPGEFDSLACGICALTTCGAILKKNNAITPQKCRDDGGYIYGDVTAKWSVYNILGGSPNALFKDDPVGAYKRIYTEIHNGKPVVIRVQKNAKWLHFVTAYGLKSGTTSGNINADDILIIDPYNPEYTNLQQLLDSCSYGFRFIFVAEENKKEGE